MKVNNSVRSRIMLMAWRRYREHLKETFSACLKLAWAKERKAQITVAKFMAKAKANGGTVCFGDLTRSPIRRALTGQPYAAQTAYAAAFVTARFGR